MVYSVGARAARAFSAGLDYFNPPSMEEQQERQPYNTLLLNNDPYKQISHYQQRLGMAGQEVPEQKRHGLKNALLTALDILDRPGNAIRNVVYDVFDDDSNVDVLGDLKRGITGQKHVYGSDILNEFGVKSKVGKTVGGFVADVLLDPTTYLTGGTAAGLRAGFSKGLTARALGGGGKEIVRKYLPEMAKLSNEDFLKETAKKLGRGVKPIDEALESEEQRILRQGWSAVNKDTINESRTLMELDRDAAKVSLKTANNEFNGALGYYMPGIVEYIKKTPMTSAQLDDFLEEASLAVGRSINPTGEVGRVDTIAKLFDDSINSYEDLGNAFKALSGFSDEELKLATVFKDTFNIAEGEKSLSLAQRAYSHMTTGMGDVRDLSKISEKYKTVLLQREAKEGYEEAIRFANGLEQVYNKTMNTTYMKYMGMPFLNLTETIGKGARIVDTKLATSAARGGKISRAVYDAIDATRYTFDTTHISRRILADNTAYKGSETLTRGQAKYGAAKQLVNLITGHVHEETALAQEADKLARAAFAGIFDNKKLRHAVAVAVEGMGTTTDHWAKDKWEEVAKTLSPEEMSVVEEYVTRNAMFANALYEGDMADIERRMLELGQEGEEGVGKLKYEPREDYLYHIYKENFAQKMEDSISPRTARERLIAQNNPKRSHMNQRKYKTMAAAEELSGGELEPIYDVVASFATRVYESRKAAINNEFIVDMEHMLKNPERYPGMELVISKSKKPGMVQLPDAFNKFYGTAEVKQQMLRLISAAEGNAGAAYWKQTFDHFTNFIKTTQTSLNPAFLLRNVVGETMMNWMANVGVEAHGIATKILQDQQKGAVVKLGDSYFLNGVPLIRRRMVDGKEVVEVGRAYTNANMSADSIQAIRDSIKNDYSWSSALEKGQVGFVNDAEPFDTHVRNVLKTTGLQTYNINGKEYLAHELMDMFYKNGLGWSGISKGNLIDNIQDLVRAKTIVGKPIEAMKSLGDATETWTRLAHFVDRLNQGVDIKTAAEDVRKFHVDYRDLTNPEKETFRRIAPYYTYMRKNTPIQLRQLFLNPGKFETVYHLIQEGYNTLKYDPQYTGEAPATPDYLKENLAIPWDIDNNGNVRYFNWNLPINDVARLQLNARDFIDTNLVSMLHPFIKAVPELYMNKSMSTEADIVKYEGESAPLFSGWDSGVRATKLSDYIMNQLGIVNTIRGSVGQVMAHQAGQDNPGKPFVGYPVALTGTKSLFPLINSEQVQNSNAFRYRDQLQEHVKMLEEEQGIDIPDLPKESNSRGARILRLLADLSNLRTEPEADMHDSFMDRYNY